VRSRGRIGKVIGARSNFAGDDPDILRPRASRSGSSSASRRLDWTGMGATAGMEDALIKHQGFCGRCIDVVFILSSLMSTCELDRFVIQTPYIKVRAEVLLGAGLGHTAKIDGRSTGPGWTSEGTLFLRLPGRSPPRPPLTLTVSLSLSLSPLRPLHPALYLFGGAPASLRDSL
jgi:hypothetical protein